MPEVSYLGANRSQCASNIFRCALLILYRRVADYPNESVLTTGAFAVPLGALVVGSLSVQIDDLFDSCRRCWVFR